MRSLMKFAFVLATATTAFTGAASAASLIYGGDVPVARHDFVHPLDIVTANPDPQPWIATNPEPQPWVTLESDWAAKATILPQNPPIDLRDGPGQ